MSLLDAASPQGFRLSPQQRRVWALDGGTGTYVSQCTLRLDGDLRAADLERAVHGRVARYEILRTTFERPPGLSVPVQVIAEEGCADWRIVDLQSTGADRRAAALADLARAERRRPFDLAAGRPLRATLASLTAGRHALVLTLPAMCADAVTLRVLAEEIVAAYADAGPAGDDEAFQYADLAEWQNEFFDADGAEDGKGFWRRSTPRPPLPSPIALDGAPSRESFRPEHVEAPLPAGTARRLEDLSAARNVPLSSLLLAVWSALLFRLGAGAGEDGGVAVGVRFAGRHYDELNDAVGPLERLLPLTVRPDEDEPLLELAAQVDGTMREAAGWQELFAWEGVPADEAFVPAAFELLETGPAVESGGLTLTVDDLRARGERFVVRLSCRRGPEGLAAGLDYDAAVVSRRSAERLGERFVALVESLSESVRVGDLDVLDATERTALGAGAPAPGSSAAPPAHEAFVRQAVATPDAVALVFESTRTSYGALARSAARLAHRIVALGAGPESRVGLCLHRSPDMVAAMLGVLEAGAAYVPLDPESPRARLEEVIAASGVRVVVAHEALLPLLPDGLESVCPDRDATLLAGLPDTPPESPTDPDALAYVVHTSGSTGRPKGVATPHRGVASYLAYVRDEHGLGPADTVLQVAGLAFDASVRDILGPLGAGAGVVLVPGSKARSPVAMLAALREQRVTCVLSVVPTFLRALLDAAPGEVAAPLRLLLVSGEVLLGSDRERVAGAFGPRATVVNQYGPTECTMTTTWHRVGAVEETVPVGRPVPGARVYLVNRRFAPVPDGAAGEVLIGGAGVTRGYPGMPRATAESFLPDPFSTVPGSRLYRTGDLGWRRADGELCFSRRIDRQVKVRGVRVEPAEVEAVLARHPEVRQAAVVAREVRPGETGLVAYYVPTAGADLQGVALRRFAEASLTAVTVPVGFVPLDDLPRTPNGKVDRKALPAWDAAAAGREARYEPPRTPIEELVAEVYAGVLKVERVGVDDDFFELGGHSLMAARAVAQLSAALEIELPLQSIFDDPAVAGLAASAERERQRGVRSPFPPPEPVTREGRMPLSYGQLRIWFLDRLRPGNTAWVLPEAVRMRGDLDLAVLERSVERLTERHEALRTTFPEEDGQPVPRIAARRRIALPVVDLGRLDGSRREAEALRWIRRAAWRPFDLANGPLVRIVLVRLGPDDHAALVAFHHMVADGWSAGLYLQELVEVYDALVSGRPVALPVLPFQYADFAAWQQRWLDSDAMREQLDYWREALPGDPPALDLPADRPRSGRAVVPPGSVPVQLSEQLTSTLRAVGRREGLTLFMILFAGFCALLHRYSGQTDLRIGNPVSGRNRPELDRVVGYFVNNLILRADLSGAPTAAELLRRVRAAVLGAYAHQDLPFARLVELLYPGGSAQGPPPFQVMFAFQSFPRPKGLDLALAVAPIEVRGEDEIERDLALAFEEDGGRLQGRLRYRSDLFDRPRMERLVKHLRLALEALTAEEDRPLSAIPLLTGVEAEAVRSTAAAPSPPRRLTSRTARRGHAAGGTLRRAGASSPSGAASCRRRSRSCSDGCWRAARRRRRPPPRRRTRSRGVRRTSRYRSRSVNSGSGS